MKLKLLFASIACSFLAITPSFAQMVGGDSDKHGCKASAGYTWSQLKKECVRMFDEGIPLTSVDPNAGTAAYIIFSPDKKKAELFIANNGTKEKSVILKKKKNKYIYKSFTLLEEKGYVLLKNNKTIYKSK